MAYIEVGIQTRRGIINEEFEADKHLDDPDLVSIIAKQFESFEEKEEHQQKLKALGESLDQLDAEVERDSYDDGGEYIMVTSGTTDNSNELDKALDQLG